jgi:DNA-binding CsgD family transcriptional regulator
MKEPAVNDRYFAVPEVVRLTPRESDVIRLIALGCTYVQVADRLGVSPHTVASHIKNAYRKLGVRSGAAAVMRAVELKLFGER